MSKFPYAMREYVCVSLTLIVLHTSSILAEGCNATRRVRSGETYPDGSTKQRYPRLITFNTQDDGDVTVDLEFAVPFITIPVKRTMDNMWGLGSGSTAANINVGAIVLAGAMVFGAAVVIPMFSSFFQKQFFIGANQRSSDWSESWHVTQLLTKALSENNIDAASCMQRTVCWITKSSSSKFKAGQAVSQDMIINGLATNGWINNMLDGTALHEAILAGLANVNCSAEYKDCKITQKSIQGIMNRVGSLFKYK